jgi:hypothetical protein
MVSTEYLCSSKLSTRKSYKQSKNGKYTKGSVAKMKKSTRSILQELSEMGVNRNKDLVIESRGSNLIESAINLLSLIKENYDIETAAELERRFINAIRTAEPAKFKRGIKKIQESRDDTQ